LPLHKCVLEDRKSLESNSPHPSEVKQLNQKTVENFQIWIKSNLAVYIFMLKSVHFSHTPCTLSSMLQCFLLEYPTGDCETYKRCNLPLT